MDAETDAIGNKELRELQAGGRHVVKAGPGGEKIGEAKCWRGSLETKGDMEAGKGRLKGEKLHTKGSGNSGPPGLPWADSKKPRLKGE